MPSRTGVRVVLCLIALAWIPAATAAAPLTGPRFTAALARPTNRSWTELPVRQVLDQLGAENRVAIFLDRRVDPGQETSLDALQLPLDETLRKLAAMIDTRMVPFGSIVYIGPASTADWLPTVAAARREDVRSMPDRGRAMLTSKSMRWDDLATPRQLVTQLATETGVPIGPIESLPHDLWASAELPWSPAVDRLTLILSQYDKTFTVSTGADGKPRLVIVDVPEEIKEQAAKPGSPRPALSDKSKSSRATVNLDRLRIKRFAVKEKPVGIVVEYLARQWNLTLEVDRKKLEEKLRQRITVTEEDVTVRELLDAILKPVGLRAKLEPSAGVLKIESR